MSEMLARHTENIRAAYAASLPCDEAAFSDDRLTIVDRPDDAAWPYTALAVTFGTGTVLSVDPQYHEFAASIAPERHYNAAHPETLERIAAEARCRGAAAVASAPELVFSLSRLPRAPEVPPGCEARLMTPEWMNAQQASGRFENGVGEPNHAGRALRNQYAIALFERGCPVAIAGVFLTTGSHEIGVDVLRAHRARGLGKLVVALAAREIASRGETPVYFCAATNIRSQRTALTTGFIPVCSIAAVS